MHGRSILEAAVEASRLRFRPILMTSFAFILGIYPLVNATGAGAASRRALGTAVFGGMIAATFLAVFFVPVFFVMMQRSSEFRSRPATTRFARRRFMSPNRKRCWCIEEASRPHQKRPFSVTAADRIDLAEPSFEIKIED